MTITIFIKKIDNSNITLPVRFRLMYQVAPFTRLVKDCTRSDKETIVASVNGSMALLPQSPYATKPFLGSKWVKTWKDPKSRKSMIEKIQSTIHRQLHEIYQQIAWSNHQISQNAASKLDRPWAICLLTSPRNASRNRRGGNGNTHDAKYMAETRRNMDQEGWILKVPELYSSSTKSRPNDPNRTSGFVFLPRVWNHAPSPASQTCSVWAGNNMSIWIPLIYNIYINMCVYNSIYMIDTYIHYITLQYNTLHYITIHYITLHR